MPEYRGVDCFLGISGGHLDGNAAPKLQAALTVGNTTMTLNASVSLTGVVMAGDTFTIAGESGSPVHTVTGGPYVAAANVCGPITFTVGIASGGAAINSVVTFGATSIVEAKAYRLRSAVDIIDSTHFGTAGYKTFLGGLVEWDGTGEANFDYGDPNQVDFVSKLSGASPSAAVQSMMFGVLSGAGVTKQFYGTVAISQFEITANVNGLVTGTFAFKGSSTLGLQWN
jgi:hypothetical protein